MAISSIITFDFIESVFVSYGIKHVPTIMLGSGKSRGTNGMVSPNFKSGGNVYPIPHLLMPHALGILLRLKKPSLTR